MKRRREAVIDLGRAEMSSLFGGKTGLICAGEFQIEERLARQISGLSEGPALVAECEAAAKLGLDFLARAVGKSGKDALPRLLGYGFFVFGLVEGGFTRLVSQYGLGETLSLLANRPDEAAQLINHLLVEQFPEANDLLETGAEGIIVAEDVAYERGLFFSRTTFADVILPEIREAQKLGVPLILHSDGDISSVLGLLKKADLAGLHSCETSGRMSPALAASELGASIVLMGGLARPALMVGGPDPADAAVLLRKTMRDMRYCFGSSTGILDDEMDQARVTAAFTASRAKVFRA